MMIATLDRVKERNLLIGILALGLVLRVIAGLVLPENSELLGDPVMYRESAAHLLAHWRMDNPFEMPLYPLLIVIFGHWQMAADIAVSVIAILLIYALARELFTDRWTPVLSALAAACYPPFIFFSAVGYSETLFITMMLTTFLFWYRDRFTIASVFAVLTILTRPIFDIAPFLLIYFALVVYRLSPGQTMRHLAVYAAIYCTLLAPWWLHNYESYGRFTRLTPNFGYQLYAGNNPLNTSGGANPGIDYSLDQFAGITNMLDRDDAMRKVAIAYIEAHPKKFIEMAGVKFLRMWRIWPINKAYENLRNIVITAVTDIPILLLSALALFFARRKLRRLSPILLFGMAYTAINMVLAATLRYRIPLEPFLLIFASSALSRLLGNDVAVRDSPHEVAPEFSAMSGDLSRSSD
jgi:hypothetical protein